MIADILLLLTFLFPRHEEAFLILANFEMHGENDLRRFAQAIVVASATANNPLPRDYQVGTRSFVSAP
jgi:hypothetical protein